MSVVAEHDLYIQIAKYLQRNPTTDQSPLKLPIEGLPNAKVVPPSVPRGWKLGTILPLHSSAVSGGGVSENMFKDMMAEMQGESPGVDAGAGQPKIKEKKEKKKKGRA